MSLQSAPRSDRLFKVRGAVEQNLSGAELFGMFFDEKWSKMKKIENNFLNPF